MSVVIEQRSRRIAVVFGGEADAGVVSVVDSLVSTRESEVTGVFVEDRSLFQMAELPFATEVCRVTTERRRITKTELERQMSVLALRAQRALQRIAERAGSRWSFRRHRGRVSTVLAESVEVDFVVLGPTRRHLASSGERHATARTVRATEAEARKPVVVLAEQTESGSRALDTGAELAERTGRHLVAFLPPSMADTLETLRQQLHVIGPARVSLRTVPSAEPSELLAAARRSAPAVVVVGADAARLDEARVGELQRDMGCPLVVVR